MSWFDSKGVSRLLVPKGAGATLPPAPFGTNSRLTPILPILLLLLSGCGYTLQHRLKEPFTSPRGVFVRMFDNQTDEVGVESVFTNALVRELLGHDELKVVRSTGDALELWGTVDSISHGVTSFTDPGFSGLSETRRMPAEIGISVGITLKLWDPKGAKFIWSRGFSFENRVGAPIDRASDRQAPSSVGLITQSLLESRYQEIARDMMRDVFDDMVELF